MRFFLFFFLFSCQYSGLDKNSSTINLLDKKTLHIHSFFFANNTDNEKTTFKFTFQSKFEEDQSLSQQYILGSVNTYNSYLQEPNAIINTIVSNAQKDEIHHFYLFFSVKYPDSNCEDNNFPNTLYKPFSAIPNTTYFITNLADPLKLQQTKIFVLKTQGDFNGHCPEKTAAANNLLNDLTSPLAIATNTFYGNNQRIANEFICNDFNNDTDERNTCFTNYIQTTFIEDVFLSL